MSEPTPMMAQYLSIKAEHPDALLFYRMGDFYELFFDDAEAAAEALSIALTKRGKHLGEDIAMCGVPVHSAEAYLLQLIRSGFRVAIAEQLEDPTEAKKRGSKSVVKRGVVRLVTPGTLTEDSLLDPGQANWLAAYARHRDGSALALVDLSTGDLRSLHFADIQLGPELARYAPRELLVVENDAAQVAQRADDLGIALTPRPAAEFRIQSFEAAIARHFHVAGSEAFGAFDGAERAALTAILSYLELTQKDALSRLSPPKREDTAGIMMIDPATRQSLELTRALSTGSRAGSLLASIDRTVTAAGARLLAERIASPSLDLAVINGRLAEVQAMIDAPDECEAVRTTLRACPDIERALSRLSLGRGGPRDLGHIRNGLHIAAELATTLAGRATVEAFAELLPALQDQTELRAKLDQALAEDLPLALAEGGVVAAGWSEALDRARHLSQEGRGVIAAMQGRYAEETGINSLKIKHNAVLGYHIEVTATHGPKMLAEPHSSLFRHRQTTANALRFTTEELAQTEQEILAAAQDAAKLEAEIFAALREDILAASAALSDMARALARLDGAAALADLAVELDWTRPHVTEDRVFRVEAGRHPVVEAALRKAGESFIANDCDLGEGGMWLLTGPNMAGKSTFLRQNALIAILAQAGSFVPAAHAEIGLVNAVWSRVGASDDLARGRSTFMVEMVETAAILNQAGERAFVILDEIGRGTATWDGLSIAWAVLEHLLEVNKCRGLFATHYHEMTALAAKHAPLANATMAVREHKGEVVFLHEVHQGAADRSYGVHVAELAGMPRAATKRARQILHSLEEGERQAGIKPLAVLDDLPLFSRATTPERSEDHPALSALEGIDPDRLTPREALDALYRLKEMTDKDG